MAGVKIESGDILLGDNDGVVVIPRNVIACARSRARCARTLAADDVRCRPLDIDHSPKGYM